MLPRFTSAVAGLVLSALLGCDAPGGRASGGAPAPAADEPEAPAPAEKFVAGPGAPVETLLRSDWDEHGSSGLRVQRSGKFVATLDEMREALPFLPGLAREDPRYVHQLVGGLMAVTRGPVDYIARPEDIEEKLLRRLDPQDVLERRSWSALTHVSAPSPEEVKPPRWEGEVLVIDCVDTIHGLQDAYYGTRHRFSFAESAWTHEHERLADVARIPERARRAVVDAFGGEVRGFLRFQAGEQGSLYLALGPAGSAGRYLWRPASGDRQRFGTWAEFSRAVDAFTSPATLAELANDLYNMMVEQRVKHDNYRVIADPAAYREEYKKNGYGKHVLRYHVDELATTEYTVRDFDAIQPPKIDGERLTASFSSGLHQPFRLEVDLSTLDWDSELRMVALFDERVVSDTGRLFGGPGPVLDDPAPERLNVRPLPGEDPRAPDPGR